MNSYYKPAFLHSLSLTTDYVALFAEICRLAGAIHRLMTGTRLPHGGRCYRLEAQKSAGPRMGAVVLNLDAGHGHTRVTSYAEIA